MGYHSTVRGVLTCKPALSDDVLNKNGFGLEKDGVARSKSSSWLDFRDLIGTSIVNETVGILPDNTIGVIGTSHTTFEIRHEDQYSADDLEDHVTELAKLCSKHGVELSGSLLVAGEDALDLWRIVVEWDAAQKAHTVVSERPRIVWADGTEETYS